MTSHVVMAQTIKYFSSALNKYKTRLEDKTISNHRNLDTLGFELFGLIREAENVFATPLMIEFGMAINGVVFGSFISVGIVSSFSDSQKVHSIGPNNATNLDTGNM